MSTTTATPSDTPPTGEQQLHAALAVCEPDRFHIYTADGSNNVQPGLVDAETAVRSGRAYVGVVRPWVWAIDIDNPTHRGFAELLAILDRLDVEYVVLDSGSRQRSGRHVFAYAPHGLDRAQIEQEVARVAGPLKGALDFRRGGTIRPPFAPHRSGGWSLPLDDEPADVLETIGRWHVEQLGHEASPNEHRLPLPPWVQPLLCGDLDEVRRLGKEVRQHDRSSWDVSLALAYRNSGWTPADFLAERMPGGKHPSPKADEQGDRAERYLRKQWAYAEAQPMPQSMGKLGLERLDDFEALISSWSEFSHPRKMKALALAFVGEARRLGKTTLAADRRRLQVLSGVGVASQHRYLKDPSFTRFVEPLPAPADQTHAHEYRLRIPEMLAGSISVTVDHSLRGCLAGVVHPDDFGGRTHVLWTAPDGLQPTGYETLRCYSFDEPRSQAEAQPRRVDVSISTFARRTSQLLKLGVLIESGPRRSKTRPRFVIRPDVDWDALAEQLGCVEHSERIQNRHDDERAERASYLFLNGHLDAKTLLRKRADISTRKRLRRHRPTATVGRLAEHGELIVDTETGEIISSYGPQETSNSAAAPTVHSPSYRASTGHTATSPSRCCEGCGKPCTELVPITGLALHKWCRIEPYVARMHEQRGLTVPVHLIRSTRPVGLQPTTDLLEGALAA